jgi:molybdopterin synthase sulfur carrier subunit
MRVVVSGNLLRFTGYQRELDLDGATLGEALAGLVSRCPGLEPVLFDDRGEIRRVHQLFFNGEQLLEVRSDRAVLAGDEVAILTALAGG